MSYLFEPAPTPVLPIAGSGELFPVRRIFCVGKNYAAHAAEMGSDVKAVFFMKPADALVAPGAPVPYPPGTNNLHHEVELVAALSAGGSDIPKDAALDHVYGYAVGVDLTRRDIQAAARDSGGPWEASKSFAASAPCGPITPASKSGPLNAGAISLSVNGEIRQDADVADMVLDLPNIIFQLSRLFTLAPGDIIFTGTPAGVGPLLPGDTVRAAVAGLAPLEFTIEGR
jgi:fumarylpyruvate hydrolase